MLSCMIGPPFVFLSTLSLRRATSTLFLSILTVRYFYPRSPCGERPSSLDSILAGVNISIHALLAESDPVAAFRQALSAISIHALLAESDLINTYHRIFGGGISIHALLAESDSKSAQNSGALLRI